MKIKNVISFLTNPADRFSILCSRGFYNRLSDEQFLKKAYKIKMKKTLNLDSPKTFNEKMQWLKIHDRQPQYITMVDKYSVKKYVKEKIGEQYIIPTLGVWDKFDDIDFGSLPDKFVLKCTHDSGGLVICRNKKTFDFKAAKYKINKCLKKNFFYEGREWAYKDVPPRIIAEEYMEDKPNSSLVDYKFFCFNGNPEMLYVSEGLENHLTAKISFFDLTGKRLPFHRKDYNPFEKDIEFPSNFNEMLDIARKLALSINNSFVRVDLYDVKDKVYFSEITLYPNAGMIPFVPEEWDRKLGDMLRLPNE